MARDFTLSAPFPPFVAMIHWQLGNIGRVEMDPNEVPALVNGQGANLVQMHDALAELEERDARKGQIVKLRFFAGLTNREIANLLNISTATVERDWKFARAWLQRKMD